LFQAAAAMLAGVLTSLPWLDERAFPLAWLGMSLWIAVTSGKPPHQAFRMWMLGGVVVLGVWFHWLPGVAANHLEVSFLSGTIVTMLAVTWDALRFGLFGFLVAVIRSRGARTLFAWPVVWVALEWLWPHLFPWRIGQSQLGCLPLCQIAEFTGAYGVSFLFMWGAAVAGTLMQSIFGFGGYANRLRLIAESIVCGLVLATNLGWGMWRIAQVEADAPKQPMRRFALIQPGARNNQMLSRLRSISREVAAQADVVVWGESTVSDFSLDLASFACADEVRAHARYNLDDQSPCPALGVPLLCGGSSFAPRNAESGPYQNTAFLIAADESIIGRYHKRVLMPWGEYAVGQQWIPGLRDLLGNVDSLTAGSSAAPLILSGRAELGALICYEDLMPAPARETVLRGAKVLVNLNNLAIFGLTAALRQHQHLAKYRSIENRRWLVRCGTTGSTAAISASGRVVAQAPTNVPATIVATVPLLDTLTFYTRWGDFFAAFCTAAAGLLFCVRLGPNVVWRFGAR